MDVRPELETDHPVQLLLTGPCPDEVLFQNIDERLGSIIYLVESQVCTDNIMESELRTRAAIL